MIKWESENNGYIIPTKYGLSRNYKVEDYFVNGFKDWVIKHHSVDYLNAMSYFDMFICIEFYMKKVIFINTEN